MHREEEDLDDEDFDDDIKDKDYEAASVNEPADKDQSTDSELDHTNDGASEHRELHKNQVESKSDNDEPINVASTSHEPATTSKNATKSTSRSESAPAATSSKPKKPVTKSNTIYNFNRRLRPIAHKKIDININFNF